MKLDQFAALLAPVSIFSGWITIALAVYVNPWFNLFGNAISDMGRLDLPTAYVLNDGLLITSLLMMTYSLALLRFMKSPLGNFSAGFFCLASFHLLLISRFPEGIAPHVTVSYQFFVYMLFSMLLFGISLIREGYTPNGVINVLCFVAGVLGSLLIEWPSTATLEVYNLVLMTIGTMSLFHQNLIVLRHRYG